MSYQVIARRYRPQRFEDVIGQSHVSETLAHAIGKKRIGHAFLFCGPRGVGKTSTARILAKALNCVKGPTAIPCNECDPCKSITDGSNIDVIEIDAASNRGVDDVRQLREYVQLAPSGGSKYRIYIIDEVHMLTTEAFNALLKTLEEPPSHAVFVLATTAKNKVPATIISRCQPFDFKHISLNDIVKQLENILENEKGIKISKSDKNQILGIIARAGQGSMRDSESILEQLISFSGSEITLEKTNALLGTLPTELITKLVDSIIAENTKEALQNMASLLDQGIEYEQLCNDLLDYLRSLTVIQITGKETTLLDLTEDEKERRAKQSQSLKTDQIVQMMKLCTHSIEQIRKTVPGRVVMDLLVLDCIQAKQTLPLPELIAELKQLQKDLNASGGTRKVEAITVPRISGGSDIYTMPVIDEESTIPNGDIRQNYVPPSSDSPTPPSSNGGIELNLPTIQSIWPQIISDIHQTKKTLSSVLKDTVPAKLEQNTVTLALDKTHKFHKNMLDRPDNRSIIEEILTRYFGNPLRIRTEIMGIPNIQNTVSIPIVKPQARIELNTERDPIVQKAIEIFGATHVEQRIKPRVQENEEEKK